MTDTIDTPAPEASAPTPAKESEGELQKTQQPSAASAPTTANDLEDELERKKQELATSESDVAQLKADIKALHDKLAEFKQATNGYDAFFKSTSDQLSDLKAKISEKTKMAKSVIDDAVAQGIDQKITDGIKAFEDGFNQLGQSAVDARTILDTARTKASQADAAYQSAQTDYDTVRKLQKTIEAYLKESQALITLAESAHDRDDHVQMYLLLQIAAQALTNKIQIPPTADYRQKLMDAKAAVDQKKTAADTQKKDVDKKSAALTDLAKRYDAAKASELADLLKQLKDIKLKTS